MTDEGKHPKADALRRMREANHAREQARLRPIPTVVKRIKPKPGAKNVPPTK